MILLLVTLSISILFLLLLLLFHRDKIFIFDISFRFLDYKTFPPMLFYHDHNVNLAEFMVLTNQTTYELVRRRCIPYLRGIPERVYPFSKGACTNLYKFCWVEANELPRALFNISA